MFLIVLEDLPTFKQDAFKKRVAEGKAFDPNDFTVLRQLAACLSNKLQQPFMSRSSLIRWMGAS